MKNICHNCLYHEKCIAYRYKNVKTKHMKKINRLKNKDGELVIYVEKCSKFTERMFKYYPVELRKLKKQKLLTKKQ